MTAQQQQQQVTQFLSQFANQYSGLRDSILELQDLYTKKLWHNITEKLQNLVKKQEFAHENGGKVLHQLYDNFVVHFETKLNFLRLAEIVVATTKHQKDPKEAIEFLQAVSKRLEEKKGSNEAVCILKTEIATWLLRTKDYEGCRDLLRTVRDTIDKTGHVDNTVHAAYYKTYAEYLKVTEDPNEFYKNALLYLAYTPIEQLQLIEQQAMAFDLGIAALLGDAIYNFGELLGHPVVESLTGSQAEWLYNLLLAFNRGNIAEYQKIVQNTPSMPDILKQNSKFLLEKVQLMSLMELVFNRPADNRIISFADVAQATGVDLKHVEPLLLKSLAYNLIKGVIDEVQQSIQVKWAQPRVLDKGQISSLQVKIGGWLEKVDRTLKYLQEQGSVGDLQVN